MKCVSTRALPFGRRVATDVMVATTTLRLRTPSTLTADKCVTKNVASSAAPMTPVVLVDVSAPKHKGSATPLEGNYSSDTSLTLSLAVSLRLPMFRSSSLSIPLLLSLSFCHATLAIT